MDLRELKKEVQALTSLEEDLHDFRENWIRPIRSNTNLHLPLLNILDEKTKKALNQQFSSLQPTFSIIRSGQQVNEKLSSYVRYLIELKLTTLNGDKNKFKMLINHLIKDDFHNLQKTINEIKLLESSLVSLKQNYSQINQQLEEKLPLEGKLFLMDPKHKNSLLKIELTIKKQKELVQLLGKHFVQLAKHVPTKKRST
jgi:hypothetical protein